MPKIIVDIDELMDKLEAMIEDDYETVELSINEDGYDSELELLAVSLENEEPISYGTILETKDELF